MTVAELKKMLENVWPDVDVRIAVEGSDIHMKATHLCTFCYWNPPKSGTTSALVIFGDKNDT